MTNDSESLVIGRYHGLLLELLEIDPEFVLHFAPDRRAIALQNGPDLRPLGLELGDQLGLFGAQLLNVGAQRDTRGHSPSPPANKRSYPRSCPRRRLVAVEYFELGLDAAK